MANETNSLSYTGRDIASIRQELIDAIPTLTDKWTDFNESDLGMILIELMASVEDMQNFYLDNQAFETYLDTAVQGKNIRSLLRAMNYRIPLMTSAKGQVVIAFNNNDYKDIEIPKYTTVTSSRSDLNIHYCVSETTAIHGQVDNMMIPVIEGEVHTINMSKDDLEGNLNNNNNVSRRIYLGFTNVADKSVEVTQSTGDTWEECDDALLKYRGGEYYSVHKDSENQVYILMSPNFLDLVGDTESLTITFITTSGTDGIAPEGALDTIDYNLTDVVRIYNPIATYGATDEPSGDRLQSMKLLARENAITMGRYITLEDFKTGIDNFPYIYQSIVKDWKYPDYVTQPYLVKVWALDRQGNSIGAENQKEILKELYSKCNVDTTVEFQEVENVNFNIHAKLVINARTYTEKARIRDNVRNTLSNYYLTYKMSFGQNISYALLDSRIRAVSPYIKDLQILEPLKDIEVSNIQFPKLNSITLEIVDKLEDDIDSYYNVSDKITTINR